MDPSKNINYPSLESWEKYLKNIENAEVGKKVYIIKDNNTYNTNEQINKNNNEEKVPVEEITKISIEKIKNLEQLASSKHYDYNQLNLYQEQLIYITNRTIRIIQARQDKKFNFINSLFVAMRAGFSGGLLWFFYDKKRVKDFQQTELEQYLNLINQYHFTNEKINELKKKHLPLPGEDNMAKDNNMNELIIKIEEVKKNETEKTDTWFQKLFFKKKQYPELKELDKCWEINKKKNRKPNEKDTKTG